MDTPCTGLQAQQLLQNPQVWGEAEIAALLATTGEVAEVMRNAAERVQEVIFDNVVHFRGLIEFSNICAKDCYYCGIRRSMSEVERYAMSADEILEVMVWNQENGYGSVTLQAGEREDATFVDFVEEVLHRAKVEAPEVGITLCCGEQTEEVYQRWLSAGAHRYLLRIETTNATLYQELHPEDHHLERRIKCLQTLKRLGYQVGTGVMIGLPGQTYLDLARDVLFFKEMGVHMIGMGPYIVQKETPTGQMALNSHEEVARRFQLSLNMIAVTRLLLPKLNIASTTALQALDPKGREQGVRCGANILMPIATPLKYRASYQLYDDKPCIEDTTAHCKVCITGRMLSVNRKIGFNQRGDAPAAALVPNFTKPEK